MERKPKAPKALPVNSKQLNPKGEAFDLWLQRGLHELYDEVANEPIPEDLLKLIDDGRPK